LLDKLGSSSFFLFINYMDAHDPYLPPRPFESNFSNTPFPHFKKLGQYFSLYVKKRRPKDWGSFQQSLYDGEIAYLDDQLGKLFSRLKEMGLYDSSLIIITSDHGELFGEHDLYTHNDLMYEGVLRVPLLIKYPFKQKTGREKKMVTLPDLFSTILAICDIPVRGEVSGKIFDDNTPPFVSEFFNSKLGEHRAIYHDKYKYMTYGLDKSTELYDLERDPAETENLAEKLPYITEAMERKLKKWKKEHAPRVTSSTKPKALIPKESLEGLKALGYIQ